jgi:hypothetical protein
MQATSTSYFASGSDDDDDDDEDVTVASASSSSEHDGASPSPTRKGFAEVVAGAGDDDAPLPPPTWLSRLAPSSELRAWIANRHEAYVQQALNFVNAGVSEGVVRKRLAAYLASRSVEFTLFQALITNCTEPEYRNWWLSVRHCMVHVAWHGASQPVANMPLGKVLDLWRSPMFVFNACISHIRHANYSREVTQDDLAALKLTKALRTFRRDPSVQNFKLAVFASLNVQCNFKYKLEEIASLINEDATFTQFRTPELSLPSKWMDMEFEKKPRTLAMQVCRMAKLVNYNIMGEDDIFPDSDSTYTTQAAEYLSESTATKIAKLVSTQERHQTRHRREDSSEEEEFGGPRRRRGKRYTH